MFDTPSACVLLTLPQAIAAKLYKTVGNAELMCIRRIREQNNAKVLDLNEREYEEMHLLMSKEMMKERYRDAAEMKRMEEEIGKVCNKKVCDKVCRLLEEHNS